MTKTCSLFLSALIGLAACSDGGSDPASGVDRDDSAVEERAWPHDDYEFTLTVYSDGVVANGARPTRITVVDGAVIDATDIATQQPVLDLAHIPTIEALFAWNEGADELDATYDEELGYPVDVTINRSRIPTDGGMSYHVRDVELN